MPDRTGIGKLRHILSSRAAGLLAVALAACVLIALTWIGVQDAIRAHQTEVRARVEAQVANAALAVEEQLRVQLLAIDQTLRILKREWQRAPQRFDLLNWQQDIPVLTDATLHVFVTDEHGIIEASTRPQLVGQDVSGLDVFRQASANSADDGKMLVGALVRGTVTRQWEMTFARRLVRPDGSFAGLLGAAYDPATLAQMYGGFDFGRHSLIALLDTRDGSVDALADPDPAQPGGSIASSALFTALRTHKDGLWTGLSPFDGIERVHAFRRVADRSLSVLVAADRDSAMRASTVWDRDALLFGLGISALVLVLAGLLVRADRTTRKREVLLAQDRTMLAEKTRQLEATLAGMTDGIMMVDAELRLLAWNDKFSGCTGVRPDILRVGLPMEEMIRSQAEAGEFGPVDVEAEVARRMELLRTGLSTGVLHRSRPNGQALELRRNPLPGGGFVTLYSDVTTRHAAEERVREAQKMAAIGRLTAGVAHDFNNLLASIMGSAELMERRLRDDPQQARRLAIILQGAQRGAELVQQLLAFSRKQPLAPIAVDPNHIVRGMSELLRTSLGGAVKVETRFGARSAALVDPVQIEHVILNLAINARDAMPDGGVLTIATRDLSLEVPYAAAGLTPGEYVAVSVTDTGTGMSAEVQRSALEPFFTTKPPGRGSGLGLSQVYGVASQSGGGMEIVSAVGQGTTVTVYLPRGTASDAAGHALAAQAGRDREPPSGRGTVMLVEDEPDVRETVAGMLTSVGFGVLVAEDGAVALRMMDSGAQFDLLLTDLVMPGINGIELAGFMRARRPALPVVIATGYNDDLRVSGERWVLNKPFVSSRLAETLRSALRHAHAPQESEPVE